MRGYCVDCPDSEACHIGASCEFTREAAAFFAAYEKRLKGKTAMTENKKTVAAKTETDEKKDVVVPEQVVKSDESVDAKLTVVEGNDAKLSFKERLAALTQKMKDNKKALAVTVVVVAAATAAVAKLVAAANEVALEDEELDETEVVETPVAV